MTKTIKSSIAIASILLLSSCGQNASALKAEEFACETFKNDLYEGISAGESDAVLAATALYVYEKAKESKNEELIDASSRLYDGFNLPDLSLASKALIDLKIACKVK
jgi:hypothetical protein